LNKERNPWLKQIQKDEQMLDSYDIGETIEGLARKLDKKPSEILKLNSNENFFMPINLLRSLLREVIEDSDPRIYPRDEYDELKEALGRYVHVSPEQIVIGTGSDQMIDLVSRALLRPGDEALSIEPTFSIYERSVKIQQAIYTPIPLREDFSLDVDKMLASATPKTKLLFLCSPNNPTANQFKLEEIQCLVEEFRGLVAIDEAYVEFAEHSIVKIINEYENLIILRTFSKAFGIASLRVGYAVSNTYLASTLADKFQMPYTVSSIGLRMGLKLLDKIEVIKAVIKELKSERSRLISRLNKIDGVTAFNSDTNFVLISLKKSSNEVCESLLRKGIIVRNTGSILNLKDCIRVSIAPSIMMDAFIAMLREALGENDG